MPTFPGKILKINILEMQNLNEVNCWNVIADPDVDSIEANHRIPFRKGIALWKKKEESSTQKLSCFQGDGHDLF
jgi:hypothetical protein